MSSPQHADKPRATAEMASADKEASQNQSEIPKRKPWNNDRKSREVAEMLKRRQVEIACVQETKWKWNKARVIGE